MRRGLFLLLLSTILTSFAETPATRIVSVGGSVTEWIVSLGSESELVGVDTTSLYPASVMKIPKVGYQRQLSAEGVASLKPSLLIGTPEMGPDEVLQQIEKLGIHIDILSNKPSIDELANNLSILGRVLNKEQEAKQYLDKYKHELIENKSTIELAQKDKPMPRVLLVLGMHGSLLAAGKDTTADWLIKQAGGQNVVEFVSYKNLSNEALINLNPDIILLADRTGGKDKALIESLHKITPALAMTKAAKDNRIITLDASLLVAGLGPRLPNEVTRLVKLFYNIPTEE